MAKPEELSPTNYEDEVLKYEQKLAKYHHALRALEGQLSRLRDYREDLAQLRSNKLRQLLDDNGLAVCSTEFGASFFRCGKHNDIPGLSDFEKSGVFEKGKLKFVRLSTYVFCKGGHYERSFYAYHEGIYQICNHHLEMPEETVFLVPSLYPFIAQQLPPDFKALSIVEEKNRDFFDEYGQKFDNNLLNYEVRTPPPENIYQCFGSLPLPEYPR